VGDEEDGWVRRRTAGEEVDGRKTKPSGCTRDRWCDRTHNLM
jgi:hypothetical protein